MKSFKYKKNLEKCKLLRKIYQNTMQIWINKMNFARYWQEYDKKIKYIRIKKYKNL